jgi:polyribonucleotide nucleotidyltransferase
VAYVEGKLLVNPTVEQIMASSLDLLYAGTESRPLMIEAGADEIPESVMKEAFRAAQLAVKDIIKSQRNHLKGVVAAPTAVSIAGEGLVDLDTVRRLVNDVEVKDDDEEAEDGVSLPADEPQSKEALRPGKYHVPESLQEAVNEYALSSAMELYQVKGGLNRKERGRREGKFRSELMQYLTSHEELSTHDPFVLNMAVECALSQAFKLSVLQGYRADGRVSTQLRPVNSSIDVIPNLHGSAYFQRGDTHVLCTATLGSKDDAKSTKSTYGGPDIESTFYLHYNFPPYAIGDVGSATSLNRRMVGHGQLAERAVRPVMPAFEEFPYTVQVFSECTSSSGTYLALYNILCSLCRY